MGHGVDHPEPEVPFPRTEVKRAKDIGETRFVDMTDPRHLLFMTHPSHTHNMLNLQPTVRMCIGSSGCGTFCWWQPTDVASGPEVRQPNATLCVGAMSEHQSYCTHNREHRLRMHVVGRCPNFGQRRYKEHTAP